MQAKTVAEEDRAASVTPPVRPSMPWRVREVMALPDFRLLVRFVDGLSGTVDMGALVTSAEAGVFAALRERALFEQVRVEHGAVTWPSGLDLAPDAMHAAIKEHGEWTLA